MSWFMSSLGDPDLWEWRVDNTESTGIPSAHASVSEETFVQTGYQLITTVVWKENQYQCFINIFH